MWAAVDWFPGRNSSRTRRSPAPCSCGSASARLRRNPSRRQGPARRRSRRDALLAQDAERFVHRAIRETEEHTLLRSLERYWNPRGRDEHIARREREDLVADARVTAALGDAI